MPDRLKNQKPALIVAVLFKKKGAIGGMAQRFCLLGADLVRQGYAVELLTTRSLGNEFKTETRAAIHYIEDNQDSIPIHSWLLLFGILSRIAFGRYSQVHIAGAGRLTDWIVKACKLSGTTLSCTFASRTLDMASYGREVEKRKWVSLLNAADKIDVLNPGHDLHPWQAKISISPCSFPSNVDHIPEISRGKKCNVAVFCGSLEKFKNPLLAIDIVEEYNQTAQEKIELIIFGKGVLEQDVHRRMNEVNARANQKLIKSGAQNDLVGVLSKANLFFSLQEQDNYPSQSVMEAMLSGCKVVATDVGDTRLLFSRKEPLNAIIDSRLPHDFVESVARAFSDLTASKENASFISSNHSIENFSRYFKNFLNLGY